MDRMEFTNRVLAMQDRLYRIACGMLRDEHDRADAVQEAVLKAWCGIGKLRDKAVFETWLTRIVINECHNRQRHRRRVIPMERVPEPPAPPPGANPELYEALMALEPRLRLVIVLYYMEGFRTREIASLLRQPEGTVKTRLKRARAQLRQMLSEEELRDE